MNPAFFHRTSLSRVVLRTRDPGALADFYARALGFRASVNESGGFELAPAGAPEPLLVLEPAPGAPPRAHDEAGLFHVAFLHPSRASLGRAILRLVQQGVPFGAGDHGVSEAIYFSDPEGNGIEIYADRAEERWPLGASGELEMYTAEVDLESVVAEASRQPDADGVTGVRIGHVHLAVTDISRSGDFYRSAFGMQVMQSSFPGALFLGRDGYHHHLGLNRWRSRRPASPISLGLAGFTLRTGEAAAPQARSLSDPDGIRVNLLPQA